MMKQDVAWTFKQWVLAVKLEMHTGLDKIEKDVTTECVEDTMIDDAVAASKKLYSILTTLLQARPFNFLKNMECSNGYELCRNSLGILIYEMQGRPYKFFLRI